MDDRQLNDPLNTLMLRQNNRNFPDDVFKYIFFNEDFWIPIKSSLKFAPNCRINNINTPVQRVASRRIYASHGLNELKLIYGICSVRQCCLYRIYMHVLLQTA